MMNNVNYFVQNEVPIGTLKLIIVMKTRLLTTTGNAKRVAKYSHNALFVEITMTDML